jgi:hypothetical protein
MSLAGSVGLGCSGLTTVDPPAITTQGDLNSPTGAASERAGALSALFGAFSSQSIYTGIFTDEYGVSAGNVSSFPEDSRTLTLQNPGNFPFRSMSGARISAIIAITSLRQVAPDPAWHIGELYALVAAAEIEMSENLCSGVPLAVVNGVTPSYGPTLSRSQLVTQALKDLDSAAAYSSGSDSIANLTAVLRGRAYVDSGNYSAAAQAVASVPLTFAYTAELSDTTDVNQIYALNVQSLVATVSDLEGTNGLPFVSANDPRVPITALQSGSGTIYADINFTNGSAPLTMASGIEAQLITAEAALAAGQINQWTATLNNLRENGIAPAMADLSADSTTGASASEQLAVMFRERAFWLFSTGHRLGDLRRLVRQYGLPANSVFPTGPYQGGPANYGSNVVYPVGGEEANTSYHGCLNLAA